MAVSRATGSSPDRSKAQPATSPRGQRRGALAGMMVSRAAVSGWLSLCLWPFTLSCLVSHRMDPTQWSLTDSIHAHGSVQVLQGQKTVCYTLQLPLVRPILITTRAAKA